MSKRTACDEAFLNGIIDTIKTGDLVRVFGEDEAITQGRAVVTQWGVRLDANSGELPIRWANGVIPDFILDIHVVRRGAHNPWSEWHPKDGGIAEFVDRDGVLHSIERARSVSWLDDEKVWPYTALVTRLDDIAIPETWRIVEEFEAEKRDVACVCPACRLEWATAAGAKGCCAA